MAIEAARLFVSVGADTSEAERGLQRVSGHVDAFAVAAGTLAADAVRALAGGMLELGRVGLGAAIDYESSLNLFGAVSGATADQLSQVGALARQLGADMELPGTTAGDAAQAMTELAKAGLSVEQSMAAARGVLQLSAAGALSNAQAAEIAAAALNSFGLSGDRAAVVADLFAAAANSSSVEVKDVGDSFRMASAIFAAFQGPAVGAEQAMIDLTTAIALLGKAGVTGSDAGTSLKQMMLQMTGPSDKAKKLMAELAASIGETGDIAYTADGRMRPMAEMLDLVARSTANLTEEQRNGAITQLFGADASRAVIALMRAGPEAFAAMQGAITEQGAAADLAGARMAGLGGAIEGFKSTVESAMTEAVLPFLPALEALVRAGADLVGGIPLAAWAETAAGALGQVSAVVAEDGLGAALARVPGWLQSIGAPSVELRAQLLALSLDGVGGLLTRLADSAGFAGFLAGLGLSGEQAGQVAGLLHTLGGALQTAGGWAMQAGQWIMADLAPALVGAGQSLLTALIPHVQWLGEFGQQRLLPVLLSVGGFLADNLPGAIRVLGPLVAGLADMVVALAEVGLMGIVTTWETYLLPVFTTWGGWLQEITGGWDNLARGAGEAQRLLAEFAAALRDLASGNVSWDTLANGMRVLGIPGFARGVRGFAGGLALVGEEGPELVELPTGANVYSAAQTAAMAASPLPIPSSAQAAGGGGGALTVVVNVGGSVVAERDLAMAVRDQLVDFLRYNPSTGIR